MRSSMQAALVSLASSMTSSTPAVHAAPRLIPTGRILFPLRPGVKRPSRAIDGHYRDAEPLEQVKAHFDSAGVLRRALAQDEGSFHDGFQRFNVISHGDRTFRCSSQPSGARHGHHHSPRLDGVYPHTLTVKLNSHSVARSVKCRLRRTIDTIHVRHS